MKERISKLYLNGYVLLAKNEYLGQFLQFLISDFKANCLVGKGNNSILVKQQYEISSIFSNNLPNNLVNSYNIL